MVFFAFESLFSLFGFRFRILARWRSNTDLASALLGEGIRGRVFRVDLLELEEPFGWVASGSEVVQADGDVLGSLVERAVPGQVDERLVVLEKRRALRLRDAVVVHGETEPVDLACRFDRGGRLGPPACSATARSGPRVLPT